MNTFHFSTLTTPPTVIESNLCTELVRDFYNVQHPGAALALSAYLSRSLSRATNGCEVRAYSGTGPPISVRSFTLGNPVNNQTASLPRELCAVLTYHADIANVSEFAGGIRPRARRRGRLYFGPLINDNIAWDPGNTPLFRAIVAPSLRTTLRSAALALRDDPYATVSWGVFSRADGLCRNVVGGWVDDAFDVQRRRGEDPVLRELWGN